jgi:hypothetical protein
VTEEEPVPYPGFIRPDLCSKRTAAGQAEHAETAHGGLTADGHRPVGYAPLTPLATGIDRAIRLSTAAAVLALAGIAAYVSYGHAYAVVRGHGETGITARLEPATIDGLVYARQSQMAAGRPIPCPASPIWSPCPASKHPNHHQRGPAQGSLGHGSRPRDLQEQASNLAAPATNERAERRTILARPRAVALPNRSAGKRVGYAGRGAQIILLWALLLAARKSSRRLARCGRLPCGAVGNGRVSVGVCGIEGSRVSVGTSAACGVDGVELTGTRRREECRN